MYTKIHNSGVWISTRPLPSLLRAPRPKWRSHSPPQAAPFRESHLEREGFKGGDKSGRERWAFSGRRHRVVRAPFHGIFRVIFRGFVCRGGGGGGSRQCRSSRDAVACDMYLFKYMWHASDTATRAWFLYVVRVLVCSSLELSRSKK
jgi:hypothetical protein